MKRAKSGFRLRVQEGMEPLPVGPPQSHQSVLTIGPIILLLLLLDRIAVAVATAAAAYLSPTDTDVERREREREESGSVSHPSSFLPSFLCNFHMAPRSPLSLSG